jgi:hypothetical protein
VRWIAADVTRWVPDATWDVWHDRAVFHFLTDPGDRRAYVRAMAAALAPGGRAIIATFAEDGPETCSGLPVARWSPDGLAEEVARHDGTFAPLAAERHVHVTPKGNEQCYWASVFGRTP